VRSKVAIALPLLSIHCALSYKVGEPVTHDKHLDEGAKTVDAFGMCDADDVLAGKRIG
jgi:hypothetical protein